MKELIDLLKEQAGLSEEQSIKAINVIKEYTKKKFPVFSGAIDKLFDKYQPKKDDDFME